MIIHIGNDIILHEEEIIGIFDLENSSISKFTKEYLRKKQQENQVISVTRELPKSFVVTVNHKKESVYLSQLAPSTLKKRSDGKYSK